MGLFNFARENIKYLSNKLAMIYKPRQYQHPSV